MVRNRGTGKRISIAIAGLLLGTSSSMACSCLGQLSMPERIAQSDLAFAGTLLSESIDTVQGRKELKFKVTKMLRKGKKKRARQVRVETNLESAACGFQMAAGERAIIFAHENDEKGKRVYHTSLCDENIVGPTIAQLDSLKEKTRKRTWR
jgi:hypothetical protein